MTGRSTVFVLGAYSPLVSQSGTTGTKWGAGIAQTMKLAILRDGKSRWRDPPYLRLGANGRWASSWRRGGSDRLGGGEPEIAKELGCACDWWSACRRCEPSSVPASKWQEQRLIGWNPTSGTPPLHLHTAGSRRLPAGVHTLIHPGPAAQRLESSHAILAQRRPNTSTPAETDRVSVQTPVPMK